MKRKAIRPTGPTARTIFSTHSSLCAAMVELLDAGQRAWTHTHPKLRRRSVLLLVRECELPMRAVGVFNASAQIE